MINFNKDSIFNLKPIDVSQVRSEVGSFLIDGEEILETFKTVRDQVVFTNKRIISIDVQGITGKRKSFSTLPYSTIQFFEVQTPGFMEIFPDTELFIQYANGFTAQFEFKGNVDICRIGKIISQYVLR
ncbi:MAG: PH domain-containing protein [Treponema sp.]|uniref:PH domain-containing protein n=1 Tax=Treponema sp. TaxID=166 RepID=UPI00298E0498|nr:PH domain-containing protein [Treponema sp.]MCR5386643.1 PH domain-containing protein [Treponema sp.]